MKTQTKQTPQIKQAKIEQLEPTLSNFQLYFEIESVGDRSGDTLNCRIVDDTGIVQAYFNRYARKLDIGGVYLMTNLKCCLVDGSLRVEMTDNTVVSKEPDIIGFKDKSNDISKIVFEAKKEEPVKTQPTKNQPVTAKSTHSEQPKLSAPQIQKAPEALIPLTKQEAMQQLRIGREMYQNRKPKYNKDKQKDHIQHKQTPHKQTQKQDKHNKKYENKVENQHKDKNQTKHNQTKLQYKPKDDHKDEKQKYVQKQKYIQKQKKQKYEQKYKEQGRLTKAKSLMYKQKKDQPKQHKEEKHKKDDRGYKNGGNRRTTQDKFGDYNYNAAEIEKKLNKYKLKQEPKEPQVKNESKVDPENIKPVIDVVPAEKTEKVQEKQAQEVQKKVQIPEQLNKDQDKKQNACINIIQVPHHLDNHVNLRAWITQKTKKYENSQQVDHYIADGSGAIWIKTSKIHLEPKQGYEIDNLEVCKEQGRVYLKQTEISEARRLEHRFTFNLQDINTKQ